MANKLRSNTLQNSGIQMTPLSRINGENLPEMPTLNEHSSFEKQKEKKDVGGSPVLLKINKSPSLPFNQLFIGGHINTGGNWPSPGSYFNNEPTLRSKSIGGTALGMFRSVRGKHEKTEIGNLPDSETRDMVLKEIQKNSKPFIKRFTVFYFN